MAAQPSTHEIGPDGSILSILRVELPGCYTPAALGYYKYKAMTATQRRLAVRREE